MEKFQISVKNLNNLWSFIEIYAVFVLNLCGENLYGEKMTNMGLVVADIEVSAEESFGNMSEYVCLGVQL